jgi:hypothetical protein
MVQSIIGSATDVDPVHYIRMSHYKRIDRPLRRCAVSRCIGGSTRAGADNHNATDLSDCDRVLIARPCFESKQITSIVRMAIVVYQLPRREPRKFRKPRLSL